MQFVPVGRLLRILTALALMGMEEAMQRRSKVLEQAIQLHGSEQQLEKLDAEIRSMGKGDDLFVRLRKCIAMCSTMAIELNDGRGLKLPEGHDSPSADPVVVGKAFATAFRKDAELAVPLRLLGHVVAQIERHQLDLPGKVQQRAELAKQLVLERVALANGKNEAEAFVTTRAAKDSKARKALRTPVRGKSKVEAAPAVIPAPQVKAA